MPVLVADDVGALEIAMDDPTLVRMREGVRQLDSDPSHRVCGQRAARDQRVERSTIHVLHRNPRVLVFSADVVNLTDAGMVERRCRARFGAKASVPPVAVLRREIGLKEFERDLTTEPDVPCEAHGSHPAAAQDMQDLVRSDPAARCEHLRADYTVTEFTVASLRTWRRFCRRSLPRGTRRTPAGPCTLTERAGMMRVRQIAPDTTDWRNISDSRVRP